MAGNWNSGRRPQPTAIKLLRGNPGKRRINPNEPAPPPLDASFDDPPPALNGDEHAKAEWRRVAPILRACGLVTEAERTALLALCHQWSRYLEAHAQVREHGMMVANAAGLDVPNPFLGVADRALVHCQRLWAELGLTPTGRARVARLPSGRIEPVAPPSKWGGIV